MQGGLRSVDEESVEALDAGAQDGRCRDQLCTWSIDLIEFAFKSRVFHEHVYMLRLGFLPAHPGCVGG